MPVQQAFKSTGQTSVTLAGTTAVTTTAAIPGGGENVLIVNLTATAIACDFQHATFNATAASPIVVPPNSRHLATVGGGPVFGSAIGLATAAGSVVFMRGDGSTY